MQLNASSKLVNSIVTCCRAVWVLGGQRQAVTLVIVLRCAPRASCTHTSQDQQSTQEGLVTNFRLQQLI
jgi:hypothetical protein